MHVCPPKNVTTRTDYTTVASETEPCLFLSSTDRPEYSNRLIRFSETVSKAVYSNIEIIFSGSSDPGKAGTNIEDVVIPFSLGPGDGIHFYTASIGWSEKEEYRVVTTYFSGSDVNRRLYAVVDRPVNRNVLHDPGVTGFDELAKLCRFIVAKHLPDETNLILRYNPIKPEFVEEGIVYPQYILKEVRDKAGNVIKSLKSQGLI